MNLTTHLPPSTTEGALGALGVAFISATFSWIDYSIFITMLVLSSAIGVYFGCFGSKQATANEYLMGGKEMKVLPIVLSMVASHVSGITLLGVPADVYRFGAGYWLSIISFLLMILPAIFVYLPVYYKLQITSIYEYLEMRFDKRTRVYASFLFALTLFLLMPIVIYVPALALSAATGINIHFVTPVICSVCIFYTTIGGLKAVVWTDTLQFTITLGAVFSVLFIGMKSVGGFHVVWKNALDSQRLNIFDFDLDFTKRDNFWAIIIGYTTYWTSLLNTNQGCVQKFLSLGKLSDMKKTAILSGIGLSIVSSVSVFTGLIIYSKYKDCDPFETKQISRSDQLLPFFILNIAGHIPGFSGLLIAGVFSAALSFLSAHLNCLSGTIYEDFLSSRMSKNITEKRKSNILKLIVVIAGIVCTAMVYLCEHLGGILPLAIAFSSVTNGPMMGIFTLGVLSPRTNRKGAFYGGLIGLLGSFCIVMTSQYYQSMGLFHFPQKPLSTDNCTYPFNVTSVLIEPQNSTVPEAPVSQPFVLFRISYFYFTLVGCILTMVVGLIISCFTEKDEKHKTRKELFSPIIHRWLSDDDQRIEHKEEVQYYTLDQAFNLVVKSCEKD